MRRLAKNRPSPAMIVALVALFVALGGVSYAALAKNSVGTKQLKKNAVTTVKIKNNAVNGAKVADGSLTGADVAAGSLTGTNLADGSVGLADLGSDSVDSAKVVNGSLKAGDVASAQFLGGTVVVRRTDIALPAGPGVGEAGAPVSAFTSCAAGETIIGGSVNVSDPATAEVQISRPALDNVGAGGIPEDGSGFAFWKGTAHTTTNVAGTERVFAICARTP